MTDGAPADLDRRTYPPHRINALADGVFAIAMTLLALEIRIPDDIGTEAAFRAELPALFGAIAVFLAGFWITAQYWIAHHRAMAHVHTVDGTAVVRTIAVLCGVAAVPVATSLITGWSRFPEAVAVAGMLLALTSLLSARLFSHVLAPGSADVDPAARRRMLATPL